MCDMTKIMPKMLLNSNRLVLCVVKLCKSFTYLLALPKPLDVQTSICGACPKPE